MLALEPPGYEALDILDIEDPKSGSITSKAYLRVDALPDVLCSLWL